MHSGIAECLGGALHMLRHFDCQQSLSKATLLSIASTAVHQFQRPFDLAGISISNPAAASFVRRNTTHVTRNA